MTNPSQQKKTRYKSRFGVFSSSEGSVPPPRGRSHYVTHSPQPPNPSLLQLSHFLIHLFLFYYTQGRIKVTKTEDFYSYSDKNSLRDPQFKLDCKIKNKKQPFFYFCKMPRHSPILQILVYFYSKQEKCNIYSYIYLYIY